MKYTFPDETVGWTALTSLEDCAAASWRSAMFYLLSTCVDVWVVGSGEGLLSPLHWEVSRPTLDHHLSGGGSGQLSPRSPSVADQRVKVEFKKVECRMRKLASTMSKVGCRKRKLKAGTNAKCWMRKKECSGLYIPLNLKIELET